MSPFMARSRRFRMSAFPPLLKEERTSSRDRESDVHDPNRSFIMFRGDLGLALGADANDFATSRAHSMKRSTTGLKVRFFNLTTATGQGRIGKSTGSNFNEK